jgi:hypothetical protein
MAILDAQEAFAPSQTIPEIVANEFEIVASITSIGSSCKYAIPAVLAALALVTPQYAESFPIPFFKYIEVKFPKTNALYNFSGDEFKCQAYIIIGTDTVIP